MTLREAKQAVRAYIRTWSTQRVAEVYAFNQDGKMSFVDTCGCIRGVAGSVVLHNQYQCGTSSKHYFAENGEIAYAAERGYLELSYGACDLLNPGLARVRLSVILRAELRLRARAESQKAVEQEVVSV